MADPVGGGGTSLLPKNHAKMRIPARQSEPYPGKMVRNPEYFFFPFLPCCLRKSSRNQ